MVDNKIVITEPTCSDEEWQKRRHEIIRSESNRIKFNSKNNPNLPNEEFEQREIDNLKLTLMILQQVERFEHTHLEEDISFYLK